MAYDASIMLSAYNQSETIIPILEALSKEETPYNTEVIISDDGSTIEEVTSIINAVKESFSDQNIIYVWQQDRGNRLTVSRNNGLRIARGDILIFIDGDCIPEDDFINTHIRSHHHENGSPRFRQISVGRRVWRHTAELKNRQLSEEEKELAKLFQYLDQLEHQNIPSRIASSTPYNAVIGRNFSYRRSADNNDYMQVPKVPALFDERMLGWGGSDKDIASTLYLKGWEDISYLDDATVVHYADSFSSTNPVHHGSLTNLTHTLTNLLYMIKKWENKTDARTLRTKFIMRFFDCCYNFDGNRFIRLDEETIQAKQSQLPENPDEETIQEINSRYSRYLKQIYENNPIPPHPAAEFLGIVKKANNSLDLSVIVNASRLECSLQEMLEGLHKYAGDNSQNLDILISHNDLDSTSVKEGIQLAQKYTQTAFTMDVRFITQNHIAQNTFNKYILALAKSQKQVVLYKPDQLKHDHISGCCSFNNKNICSHASL